MKEENQIVVYGSYGYTGKLIVAECKRQQLNVMLAGRDEVALQAQSAATGYPFQVVAIKDTERLKALLSPAVLVIHCAGPFLFTARHMAQACLETHTHYTDITGEIAVFELLASLNSQGKESGIMLLPGAGFDVVPSDCLAAHLKNKLPTATHLELAFAMSGGGSSRGTAKTAAIGLGEGSRVRKDGQIIKVALHKGIKEIDFGKFKSPAARIPWGDVSTAYHSTSIPNIEVYMGINKKIAWLIRSTRFVNWLLKLRWVKALAIKRIDRIEGPNESTRAISKSYLTGRAWNKANVVNTRLEVPNGYTLTARTSVSISKKILDGKFKTGFQTPSSAYGADFILEFENVVRTDL